MIIDLIDPLPPYRPLYRSTTPITLCGAHTMMATRELFSRHCCNCRCDWFFFMFVFWAAPPLLISLFFSFAVSAYFFPAMKISYGIFCLLFLSSCKAIQDVNNYILSKTLKLLLSNIHNNFSFISVRC